MRFRVCIASLITLSLSSLIDFAFAQSCVSAWRSLPELRYDETYISPNDSDIQPGAKRPTITFGGRHLATNEAANALSSLSSINSALRRWDTALYKAEEKYWSDFDDDQIISPENERELAYWYAKRELWSDMFWKLPGASLMPVCCFHLPAEFKSLYGDVSASNPSFRTRLRQTQHHSFLQNSKCAPTKNGTKRDYILYLLLSNTYEPNDFMPTWRKYVTWAEAREGREEMAYDVISNLPGVAQGHSILNILSLVMKGEISTSRGYVRVLFLRQTANFDEILLGTPRPGQGQTSENGFSVAGVNVVGVSYEDAISCARDNWSAIRDFYFTETSNTAAQHVFGSIYDKKQTYFSNLGLVSLVGCGSADGLNDPKVLELLQPFR